MDNERTLAALNTTVGQSGEASRKLQEAANGFARSTSRLTVFISVVAALQLWQIVGPSFLAWLRS
jgi:hypothetical protein